MEGWGDAGVGFRTVTSACPRLSAKRRAGRYDLARAVERWGGLFQLALELGYQVGGWGWAGGGEWGCWGRCMGLMGWVGGAGKRAAGSCCSAALLPALLICPLLPALLPAVVELLPCWDVEQCRQE